VHVSVTASAPLEWRQHELLVDKTRDDPRQLAMLVNRLSSRLGRLGVVSPQLQAGALPERAYQYTALTGGRPRKRSGSRKTKSPTACPLERPLWLRSPPLPLDVVSLAPSGPPALLHYKNQSHHVARHWGPERIETRWWRGRSVRRDYYRVETSTGNRYWIFRRLQDGRWFLHGDFV
jgi:protein ImuB